MIKSSANAHTVDTTHMKKFVTKYVPLDPVAQPMKPALVQSNKCDRGFSHEMLAHLLCPNKYLTIFDKDPIGYYFS